MPGNYQRTSTRKSWSQEDMARAIEAVKNKKMGWLLASKHFNVPQATLRRHYYRSPKNLGRFKPTFTAEMEKALVDHVLEFERRFFGFNTTEIRKLAYEFAEVMGLDHRFNRKKKIAGWDWLKGFRERNSNISLREPEPTSAARARAFNKPQVMKFFSLLEKAVTDNGIPAHRIYNMDESGLNTVQKPPKVFASKGKKQVGAVTSAERGEHFTVVVCANAIGNFVPPAMIIPRKNYKAEFFDGSPPGCLELCYPSGYMVSDLFLKWMKHFVSFVNASVTNKVLLILDGHSSHKSLAALEFAKANGVTMLCLPPHCTHRMQPTDVSFFGPLQTYYDREMATWMKNHPGRTVGLYQVAQIFGRAYENAASVRNITSGFQKSGIYPFNPHIFPDDMYLPSEVTENELNNDDELVASSSSQPQQNCEEPEVSESTDTCEMNVAPGPCKVTKNKLNKDKELVASGSSQPQQNHEESDSSESTDASEMNFSVANFHDEIDFEECATIRGVEERHLSPTILPVNVAHLLQDYDANISSRSQPLLREFGSEKSTNAIEQIDVNVAPKKSATAREDRSCPTYLRTLTANFVANLLKDHEANISSRPQPMVLESSSKEPTDAIEPCHRITGQILLQSAKCLLKDISPLPKAASTGKSRVNRKAGGSQVLTASPFIIEIKEAVQQKKEKENRKSLKRHKQTKRAIFEYDVKPGSAPKKNRSTRGRKTTKRAIMDDEEDLEKAGDEEPQPTPKKRRSTRSRNQTKRVILDDDEDLEDVEDIYANEDEEEEDPACIYCNELFSQSRPKEHWVKCLLCSNWCHTLCADIPNRNKQFTCELCLEN